MLNDKIWLLNSRLSVLRQAYVLIQPLTVKTTKTAILSSIKSKTYTAVFGNFKKYGSYFEPNNREKQHD